MPRKDVSVVVPVLNDFERLEACLEGLARQTVRERLEVVVSLDGGEPLPEDLAAMTDLVVHGEHAGPAAARNRGWRGSGGRFVLFTDADCVPEDSWAEEMIRVLEEGADAVKGVYSRGGDGIVQRLAQVEFEERYRLLAGSREIDMIDTYSAGFKRKALEACGGFDESFPLPDHEDVDLSYRMAEQGFRLRFAPAARVSHQHRSTWMDYLRTKHGRGRWRTKVLRRFPGKAGSDSYTPACLRLQIAVCPLFIPALLLVPLSAVPLGLLAGGFLLSTVPLAFTALRHDPAMLPLVPLFALLRAFALCSGLLRGIFGSEKEAE